MNLFVVGSIVSSVVRDIVNAAAALSNTVFNLNILTLSDSHGNSPSSTALRNSTATYADYAGVIQPAGIDVPRIQHGRMVQNKLTFSEDLTNGAWYKVRNCTAPAPDTLNFTAATSTAWAAYDVVVQNFPYNAWKNGKVRFKIKGVAGETLTVSCQSDKGNSAGLITARQIVLTSSYVTYELDVPVVSGTPAWGPGVYVTRYPADTVTTCQITDLQVTYTDLPFTPEYVPRLTSTPAYKWFPATSSLVADANGVVTDTNVSEPLHPSATINKVNTLLDLQRYATAQVVVAGGKREHGGRYYTSALGGTTNGATPLVDVGVTDWVDSGIYHADYGLMQEAAAANLYPSPTAVTTQIITLTAIGDYTLSVGDALDTGSIAITAGTATATGYAAAAVGTDVTINVTVIGTIVCTLTGTLTRAQLEVGAISSSFTSTPRATELGMLKYSTLAPAFGGNGFPHAQGSMFLSLVMGHDLAQHGGVLDAIISMGGSADLLYAGFTTALTTTDGTTTISQPQPASYYANGDTMQYGVEWDASTALYRLGYRNASAGQPWTWSAWSAYDGAFSDTGVYRFFSSTPSNFPWVVRNNIVQNTTLTTAQWDRYIQP